MGVEEAIETGARALFGEKYGDEVRVVSMGVTEGSNRPYSVELCGGTHVSRTGDIGLISVVSENAVAAGVRRIEAMTGTAARRHLTAESKKLHELAGLLKSTPTDAAERLASLIEERRKFERDLSDARKKLAMGGGTAESAIRQVNGVNFLGRSVSGVEMKDLKSLADEAKKQVGSGVVAIIGLGEDGKAGLVVAVTSDLTARFNAVDLVRIGSEMLGGKGGGGRPDMAQAGGPDGTKADAALATIEAALKG
jgi:alanyl-tRNA synthetase